MRNEIRLQPAFSPVIPAFYPVIPAFYPVIPAFYPVIPAKAGIQMMANSLATRNQARFASGESHRPFLPRHSRFLPPVIPAKAGIQMISAKPAIRNQARIASDISLLP